MTENILLDFEGYAISFENIKRLIDFFPYGSDRRIAIELLALTGMRPSELDKITPKCFVTDPSTKNIHCVWHPAKKQKSIRNEILPDWFVKELDYFLAHNYRGWKDRLFNWDSPALRRYINKKVRPRLGKDFLKKRLQAVRGCIRYEYIIQLKSFRHTWSCKHFHDALNKYGSELAIHMTGSRMKHSTTYMTARHYVSDVKYLHDDLQRYRGISMGDIIRQSCQTRLSGFI